MNDNFIQDVLSRGKIGKEWLDNLPQLIKYFENKWSIKCEDPYELSFNYVAPATRDDGSKVVLKIVFPSKDEFLSEASALQIFNGKGCAKLLEVDKEHFTMLLERTSPGTMLSTIANDEKATRILSSVIKKLGKPVPQTHNLQPISNITKNIPKYKTKFKGSKNPIPMYLLDKAEDLADMLIETTKELVVLHGDLHHGNILSAERERWLAIDPKGNFGDPVFETGAMLRNSYPTLMKQPDVKDILIRRIHIMSEELNIDPNRIQQWGLVQTVLSAVYRVEDHGSHWDHAIAVAEMLDTIVDLS